MSVLLIFLAVGGRLRRGCLHLRGLRQERLDLPEQLRLGHTVLGRDTDQESSFPRLSNRRSAVARS